MSYEIYLILTEENNLLGEMRENDCSILYRKLIIDIVVVNPNRFKPGQE